MSQKTTLDIHPGPSQTNLLKKSPLRQWAKQFLHHCFHRSGDPKVPPGQ